jgi:hypothetical protein
MLRERGSRTFGAADYWRIAEAELLERGATKAIHAVDARKRRKDVRRITTLEGRRRCRLMNPMMISWCG